MEDKRELTDPVDKRSEPRPFVNKYYSVQFCIPGLPSIYQFRLRDMSSKGLGFLIREDSAVAKHLKVGDIVDMKYCLADSYDPPDTIRTRICHMTKCDEEKFRGHYLVGLQIL